jgi:hypothetical protein
MRNMGVQVFKPPCWWIDIVLVATIMTHAVRRTVVGLVGVGVIIGSNGCCIDQVGIKGARLGLFGLGESGRPMPAIGIATDVMIRHC